MKASTRMYICFGVAYTIAHSGRIADEVEAFASLMRKLRAYAEFQRLSAEAIKWFMEHEPTMDNDELVERFKNYIDFLAVATGGLLPRMEQKEGEDEA